MHVPAGVKTMWHKMEGVIKLKGEEEGSEFEQVLWTFHRILNLLQSGTLELNWIMCPKGIYD